MLSIVNIGRVVEAAMARPIKETPILRGKDAERFEKAMKENEKKTITPEEYERIMNARRTIRFVENKADALLAIAN